MLCYPLTQRQICYQVAHVCLCCERTLENCGFVCVMLVNAQLQCKAIKHSISGHVKKKKIRCGKKNKMAKTELRISIILRTNILF